MPEIGDDEIHLWLVSDGNIRDRSLLDTYRAFLDERETARYQRFIFIKHKHSFLVSSALARSVLAQYLGLDDPAKVAFGLTGKGKPVLEPASTVQFNLSHTDGLVALAVTRDNAVGVDVEYLRRQADIINLAERYFSEMETEALHGLPVEELNDRFFDLWTLKEAYLKCCGTGLTTPLRYFSFHFDGNNIDVSFAPELKDAPENWCFRQFDIDGHYRLSVAVKGHEDANIRLTVRRGVPGQDFEEISPRMIRTSLR